MPKPSTMPDIFKQIASYHFSVVFEMPLTTNDFRFQKVSGLGASLQLKSIYEGGKASTPSYQINKTNYNDLVLTRGLFVGSFIYSWCKAAIIDHDVKPCNLNITLLNDLHIAVMGWRVIDAIPFDWSLGEFNAEKSAYAVETIKCKYRYFEPIRI